ncbi:hypothetical protein AAE478_008306 [Parahypoxylon ruwenzoriense]
MAPNYPDFTIQEAIEAAGPPPPPSTYGLEHFYDGEPPVSFFQDVDTHAAHAIFSTECGARPFRNVEEPTFERPGYYWSASQIQDHCDYMRWKYWGICKLIRPPFNFYGLYAYFDAHDIYHLGAQNLWRVVHHLCFENHFYYPSHLDNVQRAVESHVEAILSNGKTRNKLHKWDVRLNNDILSVFDEDELSGIRMFMQFYISTVRTVLTTKYMDLRRGGPVRPSYRIENTQTGSKVVNGIVIVDGTSLTQQKSLSATQVTGTRGNLQQPPATSTEVRYSSAPTFGADNPDKDKEPLVYPGNEHTVNVQLKGCLTPNEAMPTAADGPFPYATNTVTPHTSGTVDAVQQDLAGPKTSVLYQTSHISSGLYSAPIIEGTGGAGEMLTNPGMAGLPPQGPSTMPGPVSAYPPPQYHSQHLIQAPPVEQPGQPAYWEPYHGAPTFGNATLVSGEVSPMFDNEGQPPSDPQAAGPSRFGEVPYPTSDHSHKSSNGSWKLAGSDPLHGPVYVSRKEELAEQATSHKQDASSHQPYDAGKGGNSQRHRQVSNESDRRPSFASSKSSDWRVGGTNQRRSSNISGQGHGSGRNQETLHTAAPSSAGGNALRHGTRPRAMSHSHLSSKSPQDSQLCVNLKKLYRRDRKTFKYDYCSCKRCRENSCTIFVNGFKDYVDISDEGMRRIWTTFGSFGRILTAKHVMGKYAVYIQYVDEGSAAVAIQKAHRKVFPDISQGPLRVEWRVGARFYEPHPHNQPQGNTGGLDHNRQLGTRSCPRAPGPHHPGPKPGGWPAPSGREQAHGPSSLRDPIPGKTPGQQPNAPVSHSKTRQVIKFGDMEPMDEILHGTTILGPRITTKQGDSKLDENLEALRSSDDRRIGSGKGETEVDCGTVIKRPQKGLRMPLPSGWDDQPPNASPDVKDFAYSEDGEPVDPPRRKFVPTTTNMKGSVLSKQPFVSEANKGKAKEEPQDAGRDGNESPLLFLPATTYRPENARTTTPRQRDGGRQSGYVSENIPRGVSGQSPAGAAGSGRSLQYKTPPGTPTKRKVDAASAIRSSDSPRKKFLQGWSEGGLYRGEDNQQGSQVPKGQRATSQQLQRRNGSTPNQLRIRKQRIDENHSSIVYSPPSDQNNAQAHNPYKTDTFNPTLGGPLPPMYPGDSKESGARVREPEPQIQPFQEELLLIQEMEYQLKLEEQRYSSSDQSPGTTAPPTVTAPPTTSYYNVVRTTRPAPQQMASIKRLTSGVPTPYREMTAPLSFANKPAGREYQPRFQGQYNTHHGRNRGLPPGAANISALGRPNLNTERPRPYVQGSGSKLNPQAKVFQSSSSSASRASSPMGAPTQTSAGQWKPGAGWGGGQGITGRAPQQIHGAHTLGSQRYPQLADVQGQPPSDNVFTGNTQTPVESPKDESPGGDSSSSSIKSKRRRHRHRSRVHSRLVPDENDEDDTEPFPDLPVEQELSDNEAGPSFQSGMIKRRDPLYARAEEYETSMSFKADHDRRCAQFLHLFPRELPEPRTAEWGEKAPSSSPKSDKTQQDSHKDDDDQLEPFPTLPITPVVPACHKDDDDDQLEPLPALPTTPVVPALPLRQPQITENPGITARDTTASSPVKPPTSRGKGDSKKPLPPQKPKLGSHQSTMPVLSSEASDMPARESLPPVNAWTQVLPRAVLEPPASGSELSGPAAPATPWSTPQKKGGKSGNAPKKGERRGG